MLVSSTEFQNNVGKYLKLCKNKNVIITKNGKKHALLFGFSEGSGESYAASAEYDYTAAARQNPDWVTYSQFVEYVENKEGRYELIDGIIYELASPAFTHQRVSKDIYEVFTTYCRQLDSCDTFFAPFDIKCVRESRRDESVDDRLEFFTSIVQPDLMILCDYEDDINEKDMYDGTPSLVVEILSPSNRQKDMITKTNLYSDSGIKEFWIVDPKQKVITIYYFTDSESYEYSVHKEHGLAESFHFPGLNVDLKELF